MRLSALGFYRLYQGLDFDFQNTNPNTLARHTKSLFIWPSCLASHPINHVHTIPGPVTSHSFLSQDMPRSCFPGNRSLSLSAWPPPPSPTGLTARVSFPVKSFLPAPQSSIPLAGELFIMVMGSLQAGTCLLTLLPQADILKMFS